MSDNIIKRSALHNPETIADKLSLSPNLTIFSISSIETVSFSFTIGTILFSINVSKVLQTLFLIWSSSTTSLVSNTCPTV